MMDNTINGRTPKEIKKRLARCPSYPNCRSCISVFHCDLEAAALAYIQQLERERNAAVEAVEKLAYNADRSIACEFCEFWDRPCIDCEFKWRGVQEVE